MKKNENETYLQFAERMTQLVADGEITHQEWCKSVLDEAIYSSEESLRRCAVFFDKFIKRLDEEELKELNNDARLEELKQAKEELIKERKKLQTVNTEVQAAYRNEARTEMFKENICEAIKALKPIEVKELKHTDDTGVTGLLALSDFHCGSDYTVYGPLINGKQEVLNEYNFEVMKDRLWNLLAQVEADNIKCSELYIAFLGDFFENILRMTSLAKIKEPVVDTVIKFSEFICVWLSEVRNRLKLPMTVVTVGGNHDEISFLQQGNRMKDENLAKIVVEFMKLRLNGIDGIKIKPYSDASIETIRGFNILFNHGEDRNLKVTLDYFSNIGMVECDEVITGHLHHTASKSVGISDMGDRLVTRVGSICGVDAYSKQCRASARPSAYMAMYTDSGKTWSRNYFLG